MKIGASAVPQSTQASQPALQWVSTLSFACGSRARFLLRISRKMAKPSRPMASLVSTSSSQISAARFQARSSRFSAGNCETAETIWLRAQSRLIAVGRVASKVMNAPRILMSSGFSRMAKTMPYAAVAPIRGAPRTVMLRIASAQSSIVRNVSVSNSCGSRRWSITPTVSSALRQIVRHLFP